jgi:PhoPQ-activated pathogenicity-related protein
MRSPLSSRLALLCLSLVIAASLFVPTSLIAQAPPSETPLDQYLKKPDSSYSWKIVSEQTVDGMHLVVVDMISQTWLTKEQVDRPQWQHWMTFAIPEKVRSSTGMLFIGGGANGRAAPSGPSQRILQLAQATGGLVAELHMTPNQPLMFHNDGVLRTEDDLIGYTWDQYLKTGDPIWPARNAMVKGAIRGLDTITAVAASAAGGEQVVDKFVVAGGSKRGWTTWLTGLDPRVAAIMPIVIDVVNTKPSMQHHFAAYGFWAPAVGNYVQHKVMHRLNHPRMEELCRLVDPYYYRHRLTMPKYIINAAGDQFFLPDSSQFYYDQLEGEKYLRYVPNADHGLDGSDAQESMAAFMTLIMKNQPRPRFSWTEEADGAFKVTTVDNPTEVRLWQATNPGARDFRLETLGPKYTSRVLEPTSEGTYVANVAKPPQGWTAYFVELTYAVGATTPLKLTTNVRVVPDTLPYASKNPSLPTTVSLICNAASESAAAEIVAAKTDMAKRLQVQNFTAHHAGVRCYFNWTPGEDDLEKPAEMLAGYLKGKGCSVFQFQLESGNGVTGTK